MTAFGRLLERRVPHFLVAYLGAGWGVVQLLDFLERYGLSPHWTDLALAALTLMLPSVLLFTYNHGRPGKDALTRSDLVGIPLNLLVAGAVLFIAFGGQDLGATTRSIKLLDESGAQVERRVANPSYHKRLALFDFDAPAADTGALWLRYGLPLALGADLAQSMFIDIRPSVVFREKLRQLAIAPDATVPLALKRQLAEENHLPYFTDAMLTRSGNQITVNLGLYESSQGRQIARHTFAGSDVFALIDDMTVALSKDLELPQTKDAKDLRVADVFTGSLPAFRSYAAGLAEIQMHDRWAAALPHLQKAVESDPQFAQAHLALHNVYLLSNQPAKSMPPLQKAIEHEYRLPERMRYDARAEYFIMKQDKDKAYTAARMKVQLYPQDVSAYTLLSQLQRLRGDHAGLIDSYKKILELNPAQHEMVQQIGKVHESQAEFDSALHYYARYAELFPARKEPFIAMAGVHRLRGELEQARASYERALVSAPNDLAALLGLGAVSLDAGDLEGAGKQYEDALAGARTPEERGRAADSLASYHEMRGQLRRAIAYQERAFAEHKKTQSPLMVDLQQLSSLGTYVQAGRTAEARRILKSIAARLQPPFVVFAPIGELELALAQRSTDAAEQAIAAVDQGIQTTGFETLKPLVVSGRARLAELRTNYDEAIRHWQELLRLQPNRSSVYADIARCYRMLGEPRRAIEQAARTLKVRPFSARANYEIALSYLETNDRARAQEHLRRAVQVWSDADPSFAPAAEARIKLRNVARATQ